MRSFTLCALLALLALPAAALELYLVKDVEPAATPVGSEPAHLVTFRGAVLFFAGDGVSGRQLWRSDGTAAGTFQLSDAPLDAFPQPMAFFVTERLYFFLSAHPVTGVPSLWVSDGTPAGTFRLTAEGVAVAGLQRLFAASQGLLYFTVRDPEHGVELWRSDGTPAGTHMVDDVRPGPEGSDVQGLAELRGLVWFGADDGVQGAHGGALWRTDGTPAGTALALDPIPSSAGHGSVEHLQTLRNRLVFFAPPPGRGRSRQLWAGDGTVKGTFPITNLPQGTVLLDPAVAHAGRLYFVVERKRVQQLWVSDGTAGGTRMLTSAPSSRLSPDLSVSKGLGNRLIFRALDPEHGLEPWVTDGTPAGTRLLRDACPGACPGYPFPQRVFAGRLYFTAATSFSGTGLWSTDGTPAGTRLVKDGIGTTYAFFEAGGRLLFVSADHENGAEIWRTDGTAAGTVRVTDFTPPFLWEEEDFFGAVLDGQLFFNADDGEHGYELWRTDGTPSGTALVEDVNRTDAGGSFPRSFLRLGSELLFFTGAPGPPELWKSDGTAAGTVRVRTFGPEELDGTNPRPGLSAAAGGVLVYLSPDLSGNHIAVWRTDGTEAGTFRLAEGSGVASSGEIEGVGSTVFLTLRDEELGTELWATDGTVAGTRPIEDVIPGLADAQPHDLTAFQGKLYYSGIGPGDGFELWSSDGTAAGTERVADLVPGPVGSNPIFLTVHAGRLWFFTDGGEQLWSSDGTAAGTRLEIDFRPEPGLFLATFMASLGDRLVISVSGQGLWVTDGTPAGTRKIDSREVDVYGFPWAVFQGRLFYIASSMLSVTDGTETGTGPYQKPDGHEFFGTGAIAVLGDRLVFTAELDRFGAVGVWESDGTQAGTRPVEPEVRVSDPTALLRAGDRVFFPGFEPLTGWELWAVRP
ncbi:MAG: ELWxxDGT repeat protein [Thermoanaerobaculia bacterium]